MNKAEQFKEIQKYKTLILTHESSIITCRDKIKAISRGLI